MSLPIHFTNILNVSEWSEWESKQNYQNQHKNKLKCTNKHVLSKYKHRQDFRRSILVAVDNTMWDLSCPPSALRHTLLLPRMAPTQTGLCPLPHFLMLSLFSLQWFGRELGEAMFLDQLMVSEGPKYTWASLIWNNMNCSHNKVPKMLAKNVYTIVFFWYGTQRSNVT